MPPYYDKYKLKLFNKKLYPVKSCNAILHAINHCSSVMSWLWAHFLMLFMVYGFKQNYGVLQCWLYCFDKNHCSSVINGLGLWAHFVNVMYELYGFLPSSKQTYSMKSCNSAYWLSHVPMFFMVFYDLYPVVSKINQSESNLALLLCSSVKNWLPQYEHIFQCASWVYGYTMLSIPRLRSNRLHSTGKILIY